MSWELFVLSLAVLSVVNLVLFVTVASDDVAQVVATIDVAITSVFLIDFAIRLVLADRRRDYLVRGYGWLDLIACIPGLRIVRFVRVYTVGRRIQLGGGARGAAEELLSNRARTILLLVLLLTVLVVELGSMAILSVEDADPNGNIRTASDALWYLVVTISTIGYGDLYPTTNMGRLIGTLVLITGVALFSTLTGFLAHFFYGGARPLMEERVLELAGEADPKETTESPRD